MIGARLSHGGWKVAPRNASILALAFLVVAASPENRDAINAIESEEVVIERVIARQSDVRSRGQRWLSVLTGSSDQDLFTRPFGIAWDGSDLLVSDPDAGRVTRIPVRGRIAVSPEGLFLSPVGIVPCWDGVAVTDSALGRVVLMDRDLANVMWESEGLERPTGIACLGDELAVVETAAHRVVLLRRNGSRLEIGSRGSDPGEFNFPSSIALLPGEIIVGDTLNFRVQRFDRDGEFLGEFGTLGDAPGSMPRVKAITTDSHRRVWVSDAFLDQLAVYDSSGKLLMVVGRTGSAPGAFQFPAGIAFDARGRLAVVDSLNRRVQILMIGRGK